MNSQQMINGNKTERSTVAILREHGYWCYNTPLKRGGQPVDIIAAKNSVVILIDAKNVATDKVSFTFEHVEPNQITTMRYARDFAGLTNLGFAIFFERVNDTFWLPFEEYEKLKSEAVKSVNLNKLMSFETFLQKITKKE